MEQGTKCTVIIKDDERTRSKSLEFVKEGKDFYTFKNHHRGTEEDIPIKDIVRIERKMDDGQKKNISTT